MERKNEGFTLIELMIVVAIIGILAAVAVPQMGKYFDRANESKLKTSIASINNEIATAMVDSQGAALSAASMAAIIFDSKIIGAGIATDGAINGDAAGGYNCTATLKIGNVTAELDITNEGQVEGVITTKRN